MVYGKAKRNKRRRRKREGKLRKAVQKPARKEDYRRRNNQSLV